MSDFGKLLREILVEDEPYRPDRGREAAAEATAAFRARLSTVRRLGLVMTVGPTVFLVAGAWLFLRAGPDTTGQLLGALLTLFGLGVVGMGKMWFHGMVSHVQVLRELKLLRLELAELGERIDGHEEGTS